MSGKFRSSLIIGVQGIRARKLRTLLSMMSLFLGVLAVIAVQAGGQVAEKAMLADIELQQGIDGTESLYLPQHEKTAEIVRETLQGKSGVAAHGTATIFVGEPNTTPLNPGGNSFNSRYSSFGGGGGRYTTVCDASGVCTSKPVDEKEPPKGASIELRVTTMIGDLRQFRPFRLVSGRWLDFDSAPSLSPQIVLNTAAAEGFRNNRIPAELHVLGGTKNATPRIVGVVDDGQGAYSANAYMRADELQPWAPEEPKQTSAGGYGRNAMMTYGSGGNGSLSSVYLAPGSEDIKHTLRARLAAAGADVSNMSSERTSPRKRMESLLNLMQLIFLGMASLVLLIGVAGILNVGLATVGERVEEFALRRAVGTSRMLLTFIVLAETLLTGLLTALAAIGVGMLGFEVASIMLSDRLPAIADMPFPWQAGMAGVIAGLVAGLLGGLIPAIRAARIPISTVMRA